MNPPRRLVIQADNAGDNKNQWVFDFEYCCCCAKLFDTIFALFLRTGHSHEDIDAMFGSWATHLCSETTLETPQDFKEFWSFPCITKRTQSSAATSAYVLVVRPLRILFYFAVDKLHCYTLCNTTSQCRLGLNILHVS